MLKCISCFHSLRVIKHSWSPCIHEKSQHSHASAAGNNVHEFWGSPQAVADAIKNVRLSFLNAFALWLLLTISLLHQLPELAAIH